MALKVYYKIKQKMLKSNMNLMNVNKPSKNAFTEKETNNETTYMLVVDSWSPGITGAFALENSACV